MTPPRLSVFLFALVAAPSASDLRAQQAPEGFARVDHDIRIGVLPGRLRYDTERFAVRPGSKVKLSLVNNDEMQHNLLICKPGNRVLERVAAAALALGGDASARHFTPDIPAVLWNTKAIMPGQTDTIWFQAPKLRGEYPYICTLPGHTFTMKGVMTVGKAGSGGFLSNLHYELFKGRFRKLSDMAKLQPTKRGKLNRGVIDVNRLGVGSNFGVWFHASLMLPGSGTHHVYLRSDDGSRVRIDGKTVVEHDGVHGTGPERKGQIELGAGRHELLVEFFQGGGGKALHVAIDGPGLPRRSLTKNSAGPPGGVPINVLDKPVVMRVHIENASARGIAVGLPGGMNCVFDAVDCKMQFGWAGAFIDVGPDRLGRGGRPCKILGQRFEVGGDEFTMRMGDQIGNEAPTVRFLGYRTSPAPQFEFEWYDKRVTWAVRAAPGRVGLQYTIKIPGLRPSDVVELKFGNAVDVACAQGKIADGCLRVPGAAAREFVVTLTRPEGGNR